MKRNTWLDTLKEVLKELSILLLLALILAIIFLIAFLLPDSFLKNLPFEVLCVLGVIAILGFLFAISGIVVMIQRIRTKKGKKTNPEDEHANMEQN